jgi:hypothetical protein
VFLFLVSLFSICLVGVLYLHRDHQMQQSMPSFTRQIDSTGKTVSNDALFYLFLGSTSSFCLCSVSSIHSVTPSRYEATHQKEVSSIGMNGILQSLNVFCCCSGDSNISALKIYISSKNLFTTVEEHKHGCIVASNQPLGLI